MKKKIYLLILATVLIFAGCGKTEEPVTQQTDQSETEVKVKKTKKQAAEEEAAKTGKSTETEKESETKAAKETETDKTKESTASSESQAAGTGESASEGKISDNLLDFQAIINDRVYTFPMSYQEFLDSGAVYEGDEQQEIDPGRSTSDTFYLDLQAISMHSYNGGVDVKPLSECSIAGFTADSWSSRSNKLTVELAKGIVIGVSKEDDLTAAYGDPDEIYEGDSYKYLTYGEEYTQSVEFIINLETDVVEDVTMMNYTATEAELAAANQEISTEPIPEISSYQAPTELGDDLLKNIVELDGVLYQMPIPVAELIKNGWTIDEEDSDMKVVAGDYGFVTLLKGEEYFFATVQNYSRSMVSIHNCVIASISCSSYDNYKFVLAKGITIGMSEADLLKALEGVSYESDDSYSTKYYDIQTGTGYSDKISLGIGKEGTIDSIYIDYYPKSLPY